jgi:large subunit ribosomal protein L10
MSKKIKLMELETLRKTFHGVKDYVLLEPIKVDAATDYNFRKNLRDKKIRAQLIKNTFARKVFNELGIQVDNCWSGPTLFCWGGLNIKELSKTVEDEVKAAQKDPKAPEKYKIKTAIADGESVSIEEAKVRPTREEAIGDIVMALLSAGANLAACLVGPGSQLASVLTTIEEKGPASASASQG